MTDTVQEGTNLDSLNPYNYQLEILTIVNNEGVYMDVRNMMGECRIYESILNNFLMGELAIVDALTPKSLFDQMRFTGQESLRIRFSHGTNKNKDGPVIDKLFRIYKISDVQRQDQGQLMYKLSFCSPEFLTSRRFRISKAYKGSHAGIAAKIGDEYLNIKSPENSETNYEQSGVNKLEPYWEQIELNDRDENYQFVIPNWTVNYTMNWLCNQATESLEQHNATSSSSFDTLTFWYQSAFGDYRIQSLKDMLDKDNTFLGGEPFIYSPVSETELIESDGYTPVAGQKIINYQSGEHADFLEGIAYGVFAGEQLTVDLRNKMYYETEWSYFDSPGQKEGMVGQTKSSYPMLRETPELKWIGESVDITADGELVPPTAVKEFKPSRPPKHEIELAASEFKQAYSILEYQTPKIFEGNAKYTSEGITPDIPKSILIKQAASKLLKYNTITAQISARTDISAGQLINFEIPAPNTGLVKTDQEPDIFNSGNHLITEVMWSLMPTELKTNVTCMRDTVLERIENNELTDQVTEIDGDQT